jgi:hypothetical protein
MKRKLKKFNLEDYFAAGPLRTNINNYLDLDNISLLDNKGDYLIHIEYYPKEKKYVFTAYREKR